MIKSLMVQKYEERSSRRANGYLRELEMRGYVSRKPHFNTALNYLRSEKVTPILQEMLSRTAVFFYGTEETVAIDSTGFSTTRFNGWLEKRHEVKQKRRYVKFHAIIGTNTGIIAGLTITPENTNDCTQFDPLIRQASDRLGPKTITADKAYSSRANLELSKELSIVPLIPFKKNARQHADGSPAWSTMYRFFMTHNVLFLNRYHQRSNVEAVFSTIKRKITESVRGKTFQSNVNELILVALVHNICVIIHELVEAGFDPKTIDGIFCAENLLAQKKEAF